jgi:O-antigen/teichoic acid export membrane protein
MSAITAISPPVPETEVVASTGQTISKNALATMLSRVVYMVTRLFIPPFVLSRVGLEAYGLWTTAFILVAYLGVSTLGISNVYIKFIAEYKARREYEKASRLVSTGLMLTIPLCSALFGGVVWCWPMIERTLHLPPYLASDGKATILIVVLIFLSSISLGAFSDVLAGAQQIAAAQRISIISFLVETGLIFLLVGLGRGIRGLAEAYLFRQALTFVLSFLQVRRTMPWLKLSPRLWSREALKLLLGYGGIVQIQSLLTTFLSSLERVIAVPLIGVEAAGLLDLSKKWPGSITSIPSSIMSALLPAASHLQASANAGREELQKVYLLGCRYVNLSFAYFAGFIGVLAGPILHVWLGKHLEGAELLMIVFTVSLQFHMLTGPGSSMMSGLGKPSESLWYTVANLIALCISFPVMRLLIGRWDVRTIGAGVALGTVLSATYFVHRINRKLGVSQITFFTRVLPAGVVPYLLAAPLWWPVSHLTPGLDRIRGAVVIALAGVVYSGVFIAYAYHFVLEAGARRLAISFIARFFPRFGAEETGR